MEQEIEKYEGEPLPDMVPASPPRNPEWKTRQPRYRRVDNIWELRRLKELWIRTYRACGNIEVSCQRVGRDIRTFYRWLNSDKVFKEEYLKIKAAWEEVTGEVLQNLDLKAVGVIEASLDQTDDARLRADIAVKVLRAHGYLPDKAVVEQTGPGGGPVKVVHTVELVQPQEEK